MNPWWPRSEKQELSGFLNSIFNHYFHVSYLCRWIHNRDCHFVNETTMRICFFFSKNMYTVSCKYDCSVIFQEISDYVYINSGNLSLNFVSNAAQQSDNNEDLSKCNWTIKYLITEVSKDYQNEQKCLRISHLVLKVSFLLNWATVNLNKGKDIQTLRITFVLFRVVSFDWGLAVRKVQLPRIQKN